MNLKIIFRKMIMNLQILFRNMVMNLRVIKDESDN